jgi:hypothetical protein
LNGGHLFILPTLHLGDLDEFHDNFRVTRPDERQHVPRQRNKILVERLNEHVESLKALAELDARPSSRLLRLVHRLVTECLQLIDLVVHRQKVGRRA